MELYLPSSQTSSRLFGTNIMMPMQFQMAFKTHLCKYIINNKIKIKLQTLYEITSRVVVVYWILRNGLMKHFINFLSPLTDCIFKQTVVLLCKFICVCFELALFQSNCGRGKDSGFRNSLNCASYLVKYQWGIYVYYVPFF